MAASTSLAWAEALRELRERHALSQEAMAERVDVDRTTVSRWESGRNRPQPSQVRRICVTFAVSAEQLGFVESDPMKRRDFARGLLGAGVMAALGPLDALAPDQRPAERFLRVRETLADNDNLFGPRQVIPEATRQVQKMQRMRSDLRGADLRELLQVQTQFADLLGWLHQDSGDFTTSQFWMDRALEWAHLAGDHDSVAFVLARKGQLAGDMGDPIEAVDVAEAAIHLARPKGRVGAVAATYAAHGHALHGDRAASDRLYSQALAMLDQVEENPSPWAMFFDAAYIGVQRAHSLAVLGEHQQAAAGFRAAIDNLQPGYHRDLGVYLAREAQAHAGDDELDHAAALGLQALAIGVETKSARIASELGDLDHALRPWNTPDVARFHAALAEAGGRR